MAITITKDDTKGLEAVPIGDYECELDKVEMRMAPSGFPCFYINWAIVGDDCDGRILFDTISTSPQSFPFLSRLLEATGHDAFGSFLDSDDDEAQIELDEKEILEHLASFSQRVSIRVKHQKYQGDMQARVARIRASTARAVDQLLDDDLPEDEVPF